MVIAAQNEGLDPAPREYPASVTLVRRVAGGPNVAPSQQSIAEVEAWLLGDALRETDLLILFEQLVWRLVAAGLPLDRMGVHLGTLHPQLFGFLWAWNSRDGLCDEARVAEEALQADSYLNGPLFLVIEKGETVRADPSSEAFKRRFPMMGELADLGLTDYAVMPLADGSRFHNVASVGTCQPGGFGAGEFGDLRSLLGLFALHLARHIAIQISRNVVETYLGTDAGRQVIDGSIRRGSGAPIDAVVWMSDLRGFTGLSDRLSGPDITAVLNAFFEAQVGAVLGHGGEVLKFIGDGLLAVFRRDPNAPDDGRAATAALGAAQAALDAVERLNATPPERLREVTGWQPLKMGIGLHAGPVFFGNLGAPDRLDFTVIGRTVNEVSRVEALCKVLDREILLTEEVARHLDVPLENHGAHPLRGVSSEVVIFSPLVGKDEPEASAS